MAMIARERMAAWGEQWDEDEALPGTTTTTTTTTDAMKALTHTSHRLDKLKAAKRKY